MRITVLTSYFPTSARPYGGNSAFQTLLRIKPYASIEVVSPQEHYPDLPFLRPARYEPPDLTWQPPEFETTYVSYPAVPLLSRPFNGKICARILLPHVRMTRPDLILNYWLYPDGYAAVRIARELGVPAIVGAIGSDLRQRNDPFTVRLVRETMLGANAVITVSEELRRQAMAQGVAAEKITAIPNGCDTAIFHPGDRAEARAQLSRDAADELIVFAGNLLVTKGLGELIDAFISLAGKRPRARLAMVGQGPYRDTLARRAAAAGVHERVLLPGRCDAAGIATWMRAADVFCLPSYSEGCPNVVVEGLACGRPIVATNVGGIPELVKKDSGILIPPRDTAALSQALDRALSLSWDTAEIARTSTRSWESVAAETLAICRAV
ncbi:MAG TPA: glycosyltransferase [Bryobacteraceae bacterium]|jgi:glycosyltransferase involved in cell wall biosynthesis|nr:glycosyltransferase [Bryobacteraceae bacterium]